MTLQTILLLAHLNIKYPLTARPIRLRLNQTTTLNPAESKRILNPPLR